MSANRLPQPLGGRRRGLFAALVANGAGHALCVACAAFATHRAFDAWVLGRPSAWNAFALAALLVAASLGIAALKLHELVVAERFAQSYVRAVRLAMFDRLGQLPPRRVQRGSRGGQMLRFVGDLTALRQWLTLGLARSAVAGISLALLLPLLAWISPYVAALVLPVLTLGAATTLALGPRMRAAVREARRRRSRVAGASEESIASIATIQAFGQLERERGRLARRSNRLAGAMIERARMTGRLRAVAELTTALSTLAIIGAGALGAHLAGASPGMTVSAMTVLGLSLPMLRDLSRAHEYWQAFAVSRENLRRFMAEAEGRRSLARGESELARGRGEIRIDSLEVAGALHGVSVLAPAGAHIAIVGAHGAGKSTLLAVIARLLDPDAGTVRIDGTDVTQCPLATVRSAVGFVGPDLPLMRGSLEHNLRYRRPNAGDEELRRVARITGLEDLLASRERLAARVTSAGTNLSAGERQRLALARALLGEPRILLLDGAEAHLDAASAAVLDRVVASFPGTVLMATHDLARARRADAVWHLDRGRLVSEGPPAQLLRPGEPAFAVLSPRPLRSVA